FPAGGPTDQVMRAFAEVASRELKQAIVVENKPGGGGTLAPRALKPAGRDGSVDARLRGGRCPGAETGHRRREQARGGRHAGPAGFESGEARRLHAVADPPRRLPNSA